MTPSSLPQIAPGGLDALPRPRHLASAGASRPRGGTSPPAGTVTGLSIVLPCFNEEHSLVEAVQHARAAAERVSLRHEVIVVDDGSSDGTAELAAGLAGAHAEVRVLMHVHNRGYGAAVRTGIAAARMPFVLLTDADLQFDFGELDAFACLMRDHDAVVGYRMGRRDPLGRRAAAAAWNGLVRALYGLQLRDVDCAFKLFRRDLLARLDLSSTGAMFSTELMVRSVGAGARMTELGVQHYPRLAGRPSGGSPRVVVRAFRELARLHRDLVGPTAASPG